MSFNRSVSKGYYNVNYGWIEATTRHELMQLINMIDNRITNIENIIDIDDENTTTIKSENLNVGRYIYMYSNNQYNESPTDSGLVMNIKPSPNTTYAVDNYGFSASSNKVHIELENGLSPNNFLAVQSESNTGIYEILSHTGFEITINDNPSEPFCKTAFIDEQPNGTVSAVSLQVIRACSDGESEVAYGNTAPLTYHKYLYDTKSSGELGKIILTDDSDQIESGPVAITIDSPTFPDILPRSLTVPATDVTQPDDEFVLADHSQALTKKTIIDTSNDVRATRLAYSGGSLNISGYTAPTSGQMLTNGGWKTLFTVSAGNGLNASPSTGGGSGNTNVTISLNRDLDDPNNDPEGPTPDPPVPSGTNINMGPISVTVPINVAIALAGAIAVAGVAVGAAGAFAFDGAVNSGVGFDKDGLYGDSITPPSGTLTVNGDQVITGDLTVLGTTTSVNSVSNNVSDRYLQLNANYVTNADLTTGIFSNKSGVGGSGTESEIVSFTADTNSYFTVASGTFVEGDIVQIYSVETLPTSTNLGVVEIFEQVGSNVYIKGGAEAATLGYVRTTFTNETPADNTLYAKKINVSLAEFQTDGSFNITTGSNALSLTSHDVAQQGTSVSFTNMALTTLSNDSTPTKILLLDGSNNVKYQSRNYGVGAGNITCTSAGGASNLLFYRYQRDDINQTEYTWNLQTLNHTMVSADSKITCDSGAAVPPDFCISVPIELYINGMWEDCHVVWPASSNYFYFIRHNNSNFPAGATVRLGLDNRITGTESKPMCQVKYRNL